VELLREDGCSEEMGLSPVLITPPPPCCSVAFNVAVSAAVFAPISNRFSDNILVMLAAPIAVDIAIRHPYLSPL
jgi:hypothetical protein